MKAHEAWDEDVVGGRVAGNGFDEPKIVSFCETVTKRIAVRANARVKAEQSPTSGALPAPSTRQLI
jgi:hypothetical protein